MDANDEMKDYPVFRYNQVDGYTIYSWPEFKAFAQRLGIHYGHPTLDLNIFIPLEGFVTITHEYRGMDTKILKPPQEKIGQDVEITKEDKKHEVKKLQELFFGKEGTPERQILEKQFDDAAKRQQEIEDQFIKLEEEQKALGLIPPVELDMPKPEIVIEKEKGND
jgi:hypothetical protein